MPFKCEECGKEFNTENGLSQHKADKHSVSSHEKREAKKQKHEESQKASSSSTKRKKLARNVAIAGAVIVVMLVAYWFVANSKPSNVISRGSSNSIGSANASVVMVEYSDFQCPFCGQFFSNTESQVRSQYVDTGKIRFVYKNFPLNQIHNYAEKAAEAAECAADQGKFWEYHDKLFQNQASLYINSLKDYASQLGLNTTQFNSCLDSGMMQQRVSADYQEGVSRGVQSTPTFFVNNIKVEGAQSFSAFKNVIDSQLSK